MFGRPASGRAPRSLGGVHLVKKVLITAAMVVGSVTGVASSDVAYPSGYDPAKDGPNSPVGHPLGVPFTTFTLQVSEYVKGSGPTELLLRQLGDFRTPKSPGGSAPRGGCLSSSII